MNPKEIKEFLNGQVKIEVNSKYPAGQGYMPQIIQETHYNISLNGHRINVTESAFYELLRVLENNTKEEIVVAKKNEEFVEKMHEAIDKDRLEVLREEYRNRFEKDVPPRFKNNIDWIEKALAE